MATRRERQSEQTRRDIVAAARALFAAKGYAATSVAEIAAAAEVSVQTIYDSLGSKRAIVRALNDLIDEEGGVAELAGRIPETTDPVEVLRLVTSISRNINERCEDIVSAVYSAGAVEPELGDIGAESRRRHRDGVAWVSRQLAGLGALRSGLAVEQAADVIAAMTDPQVARTFVHEYGWSWARWHDWTVEALTDLVLAVPPASSGARRRRPAIRPRG